MATVLSYSDIILKQNKAELSSTMNNSHGYRAAALLTHHCTFGKQLLLFVLLKFLTHSVNSENDSRVANFKS